MTMDQEYRMLARKWISFDALSRSAGTREERASALSECYEIAERMNFLADKINEGLKAPMAAGASLHVARLDINRLHKTPLENYKSRPTSYQTN